MVIVVSILSGTLVFAALIIAGLLATRRAQQNMIAAQQLRIDELEERLHVTVAPERIVYVPTEDYVFDDRPTIPNACPVDLRALDDNEPTLVSPVAKLLGR